MHTIHYKTCESCVASNQTRRCCTPRDPRDQLYKASGPRGDEGGISHALSEQLNRIQQQGGREQHCKRKREFPVESDAAVTPSSKQQRLGDQAEPAAPQLNPAAAAAAESAAKATATADATAALAAGGISEKELRKQIWQVLSGVVALEA